MHIHQPLSAPASIDFRTANSDYHRDPTGGDDNLAVVLGMYVPHVQCRGSFGPEWSACRDVLGDMPAGKARMIFGPRGAPEVQQGLPAYIGSCKFVHQGPC